VTEGRAPQNRMTGFRVGNQRAVAALGAVAIFAWAETLPGDALPLGPRRGPGQDHARLARTACALRHLADQYPGLSFAALLDSADEQYRQPGTGYARPATARQAQAAGEAIGSCEHGLTAPGQYRGSLWPPDIMDYLRGYADRHGQGPEEAVAGLTTRLLAALRHYADHQGTDFQQALAAGLAAHARQRLSAEGPFRTGQDPAPGHAAQPAAPFPPCATNQGVVVSAADAEWLLVRTAARNYASDLVPASARSYASEFADRLPDPRDADDERALNHALADARGQHPNQVFAEVTPGIAARIMQLTDAPGKAAELGREHGRSGTLPYCDISTEGEAAALMGALGETEPMTDANRQYRALLVTKYAGAYRDATARRPPPAGSPALIAARGFPRTGQPPAENGTPGPPSRRAPPAPSRHGPRRGT
jgi:hypothetical protein